MKKIADVDFSIQHICVCKKAKNAHLKHNLQYKKQAFLSDSAWICAIMWEKCEENCVWRTSVFNLHVCKKAKIAELKHDFQCTKQAFLSDSAWICANLWEDCEENCVY